MQNKRGQLSILTILLIIGLFFFLILALVGGITITRINDAFDQDLDMGNVNWTQIKNDTWGVYSDMYLNYVDWWGISLIGGMILGLFLSAYFLRGTSAKFGIIIDIFIIIMVFIASMYVSSTYQSLLTSLSEAGETFLEDYTPKTSMFLLNLPIYIVIIGVVIMVLFHSSIPRKTEERYMSGGYLQGI